MKVRPSTNLTLLGAWNTAILTPDWILSNLPWLGSQPEVPIEVALGATQMIRFTINNVLIQPAPTRLDLIAKQESKETYELIERIALGIVEKLPHTPVSAVGHNIAFILSENEDLCDFLGVDLDALQAFYRQKAEGIALNVSQVKHVIEYAGYVLNLTCQVTRNQVALDFNHHYTISVGAVLSSILKDFTPNIERATVLAKKLVETK